MPPQGNPTVSWVLNEADAVTEDKGVAVLVPPSAAKRKYEIVWQNVIYFILLHLGGLYGAYLFLIEVKLATFFFTIALYVCSGLGITAGVHRLWSHRAYKARLPLRILLAIFNTIAFQDSIIHWARDHRTHHKYSETDADPHNATRGFFFSHIGWLCVRKHPEIKAKAHTVDVSDLWADPVLRFQKKFYAVLMPLACIVFPAYIPTLWDESLWNAFYCCVLFRYCYVLNVTWLVNSAAHIWGDKPYDKNIKPVETIPVSIVVLGEGFHNYHHTFPWDYKTGELGNYAFNYTNLFLDVMAFLGLAYDFKTVSPDIVKKRVQRTGDGSHTVWGWGDKDISKEYKEGTLIINPEKIE